MANKPMWLEKDGKIEFHPDSEAAKADGWEEPEGVRSNGEPWNPEPKEGELTQAEVLARTQEPKSKAKKETKK